MPVINKIDVAVAAGTKSISDEESKDYEEDEAFCNDEIVRRSEKRQKGCFIQSLSLIRKIFKACNENKF